MASHGPPDQASEPLPASHPSADTSTLGFAASDQRQVPTQDHDPDTATLPAGGAPQTFGRYRIQRLLGKGGMGEVYLALDTLLERTVALKLPRLAEDRPAQRERFLLEARAAALLSHAGICPVFDVGEIDGRPYLTMAFVDGQSLAERLRQAGPLPQREAARLIRGVALAMRHAHDHGILHRDLKPTNIMLSAAAEPIVMDFGLAFRFDSETSSRLTEQGLVIGTPGYMPPEQINGQELGPAVDVYSLGVVLYEQLLTGKLPFEGPLGKVIAQIESAPPPPPGQHRPDIDPALEAICLKALAKRPSERYPDMAAFAQALEDYGQGNTALIERPPLTPPVRPRRTPHAILIGSALALAAAAALAVVLGLRDSPPDPDPVVPPKQPSDPVQGKHQEKDPDKAELNRLFAALDGPVKKVQYEVTADKPTRIGRQAIPKDLLKDHDGPLYFMVSGQGGGHVLDLTDQLAQGGEIGNFGGDCTVLGPFFLFLAKVEPASRFYITGGPARSILAPMNVGDGSRHVEFDGTHLLNPKINFPTIASTQAGPSEIAGLRNPSLTNKVTWSYPTTKWVIYTRPSVIVVPGDHEQRKRECPDIYNLVEYDRRRHNVAPTITYQQLQDALNKGP